MNALVIGIIAFTCTFGGTLTGIWLKGILPAHHTDDRSKESVQTGIGMITMITALILGLVTASGKESIDSVNNLIKGSASEVLSLDRMLARYGTETKEIRKELKAYVGRTIELTWPRDRSVIVPNDVAKAATSVEFIATQVNLLDPQTEDQKRLKDQAMTLTESLLQTRWIIFSSQNSSIPLPFLIILLSWLAFIFTTFGLFAPRNGMTITVHLLCAFAVATAFYLILEMDSPFHGIIKASSDPLRYALDHMGK
jgi:hypothetical protein